MNVTDMARQPKAKAGAHGKIKTAKFQTLFTDEALEMTEARAASLGLSRSEYLERAIRWIEEHWDAQLNREIGGNDNEQ